MGAQHKWAKPGLSNIEIDERLERTRALSRTKRRPSSSSIFNDNSYLSPLAVGGIASGLYLLMLCSFIFLGKGLLVALHLAAVFTLTILTLTALAFLWIELLGSNPPLAAASLLFPPLIYAIFFVSPNCTVRTFIFHFATLILLATLLALTGEAQMLEVYKVLEMTTTATSQAELDYLRESIQSSYSY